MEYRARFTFTEQIVVQAARDVLRSMIPWPWLSAMFILGAMGVFLLARGDTSWRAGFLLGVACLGVAMQVNSIVYSHRMTLERFKPLLDQPVEIVFSDAGIQSQSSLGTTQLSWPVVRRVRRLARFWLFFVSSGTYTLVPVASTDEAMRAFVVDHVHKSGGRID